jgi:hypothetical protein
VGRLSDALIPSETDRLTFSRDAMFDPSLEQGDRMRKWKKAPKM